MSDTAWHLRADLSALIKQMTEPLSLLSADERDVYRRTWSLIARLAAPIIARNLDENDEFVQTFLDKLALYHLLWFDSDLGAVLQCPPFSALYTSHQVKSLGWARSYACSFIDAPLTLLFYGPNTWIRIEAICPRSGETLAYRAMMDQQLCLKVDAPPSSAQWCTWIPLPASGVLMLGLNGDRSKINGFYTRADFDIYQQYQPAEHGVALSFDQTVAFCQELLRACYNALSVSD